MGKAERPRPRRRRRVLPGFGLSLGYTLTYLGLLVIVPLSGIVLRTAEMEWIDFWDTISSPRALAAYGLSFGGALLAAGINLVFGTLTAWVLVRYRFPGRGLLDAMVDLPFAVPTAVAGIALTATWGPDGPLGAPLAALGIKAAYSRVGVIIAMVFVSLPFAVRTVQPLVANVDRELEEAAATLGAGRIITFAKIILPGLAPAMVTGFALSFARSLGEYGSVVFISGNMPLQTEIVPLSIMNKLEQFDYRGAAALAVVMLVASFAILILVNGLQWRLARGRREARGGERCR